MKAVLQTAKQNTDVLKTLKLHIGMGLSAETTEDNSLDLQIRIAEVEAEFQKMLKAIAADNVEAFDEEKAKALMDEKAKLQIQLDRIADTKQKRENAKSRLDEIFTIIEALANHPIKAGPRERNRRIQREDQGGLRRRSRSNTTHVIASYPPFTHTAPPYGYCHKAGRYALNKP